MGCKYGERLHEKMPAYETVPVRQQGDDLTGFRKIHHTKANSIRSHRFSHRLYFSMRPEMAPMPSIIYSPELRISVFAMRTTL